MKNGLKNTNKDEKETHKKKKYLSWDFKVITDE